jgi:hypothetical protein
MHDSGVVDHICQGQPVAGLEANNVDASLGEFVRHRATTGAGTDYDNDRIIV